MISYAQVRQYLDEVQTELKKVVYPTRTEVRAATIVVLITVAIITVFLGLVDRVLSQLVAMVIG